MIINSGSRNKERDKPPSLSSIAWTGVDVIVVATGFFLLPFFFYRTKAALFAGKKLVKPCSQNKLMLKVKKKRARFFFF
jgi:hypothetical protein